MFIRTDTEVESDCLLKTQHFERIEHLCLRNVNSVRCSESYAFGNGSKPGLTTGVTMTL